MKKKESSAAGQDLAQGTGRGWDKAVASAALKMLNLLLPSGPLKRGDVS